jgi:Fur family ferric uptake transcriptional regulator
VHVSSEALLAALKADGLRLTAARRAVCEVLAASHDDHLTASDLGGRVEEVLGRPVDPSTIYRTIDVLERAGHVHHVHFGHGPGVVHLVEDGGSHHHLVCEVCGRTVDVPLVEVSSLLAGLERKYGFGTGSAHFALMARCASCS